jgi:hypothetical protein
VEALKPDYLEARKALAELGNSRQSCCMSSLARITPCCTFQLSALC